MKFAQLELMLLNIKEDTKKAKFKRKKYLYIVFLVYVILGLQV